MSTTKMFRDRVVSLEQTLELGEKYLPALLELIAEALHGFTESAHDLSPEDDLFVLTLRREGDEREKLVTFTRMVLSDPGCVPAAAELPGSPARARILECLRAQAERPRIDVTFRAVMDEEDRAEADRVEGEWRRQEEARLAARRAEQEQEERRAAERRRQRQQEEERQRALREKQRAEQKARAAQALPAPGAPRPQASPGEPRPAGQGRRRRRRGGQGGGPPSPGGAPPRPPREAQRPQASQAAEQAPRPEGGGGGGGGRRRRRRGRGGRPDGGGPGGSAPAGGKA